MGGGGEGDISKFQSKPQNWNVGEKLSGKMTNLKKMSFGRKLIN